MIDQVQEIEPPRMPKFDVALSTKARLDILDYMNNRHIKWVTAARSVAVDLATKNGDVVTDEIKAVLDEHKCYPKHHNAWGAVCVCKELRWTGRVRRSAQPKHNGNFQKVWVLA